MLCADAIQTLKAAADPTRFRLLNLLRSGEATVGELQSVLGQSQPRVSRHLRLLNEAGLVTHFRDGQLKYFRLATRANGGSELSGLLELTDDDPSMTADRDRLIALKGGREANALRPDVAVDRAGSSIAAHRPDAATLSSGLDDVLPRERCASALVLGCGQAMLAAIAERADRLVATDDSKHARQLARARLHRIGAPHVSIRNATAYRKQIEDDAFEWVVVNEVPADAAELTAALDCASRTVQPGGRVLIFGRVTPVAGHLVVAPAAGSIPENQLRTQLAETGLHLELRHWIPGRTMEYAFVLAAPAR